MMGVFSANESQAITPLARQTALPATPGPAGHRPAGDRLCQFDQGHRRADQRRGRSASGGEAAGRNPGNRRDSGRNRPKPPKRSSRPFADCDANILVQEFISEAGGSDIRVLVVGQKVVAAMRRTASPGEFRSNLHRGGTAERVKLTPEGAAPPSAPPKPWASTCRASTCSAPTTGRW